MKNYIIGIGAALVLAVSSHAQDCPICPGGTNGTGGGPYTNPPAIIQTWPSNATLVRIASIVGSDNTTLVLTNYGWAHDTNGNIISAGQSPYDSGAASAFSSLNYNMAITNTAPDRIYIIQYAASLTGPWFNAMNNPFYGSLSNKSELNVVLSQPNPATNQAYFWRTLQLEGFAALGHPAKKPQGMGQFFGCPSVYVGFIDFTNWPNTRKFYEVDTNWPAHYVTDLDRPTNHIQLFFPNGVNCNIGTAMTTLAGDYTCWPSVYFYNDYPTTNDAPYRLWFQGFIQPTP